MENVLHSISCAGGGGAKEAAGRRQRLTVASRAKHRESQRMGDVIEKVLAKVSVNVSSSGCDAERRGGVFPRRAWEQVRHGNRLTKEGHEENGKTAGRAQVLCLWGEGGRLFTANSNSTCYKMEIWTTGLRLTPPPPRT